MLTRLIKQTFYPTISRSVSQSFIKRDRHPANTVTDTRHVNLRGTYIKGNYDDLPNLIFFPELCDRTGSWINFFTKPEHRLLAYRNIHILYPRNFGNSDRHESYDYEDMANDVVRYMYDKQISTATLAGHGQGGKLALAVGCYHAERVTGVIGLDSGPLDHRGYEAYHELKGYVNKIRDIDMRRARGEIDQLIDHAVADRKWRQIFKDNIVKVDASNYRFDFDVNSFHRNLNFNKADSVGYWAEKHGLWTGRAMFAFPEYSRWVHLGTNTLPMYKVCPRVQGYGKDIFAIQGDENPLNHWIYDDEDAAQIYANKMRKFLNLHDGVHVLLQDRSEIGGGAFIPDKFGSRSNSEHVYGDYSPPHLHHNWRYSNIYEESKRIQEEKTAKNN